MKTSLITAMALIAAAGILLLWMFPPWKIYEPVIIIAAVYLAVLLVEKPSRNRHLMAGIFVGVAAFFGTRWTPVYSRRDGSFLFDPW